MPRLSRSLSPPPRLLSLLLAAAVASVCGCDEPQTSTDEPLRPAAERDAPRPGWDRATLDEALAPEGEGLLPRMGITTSESDALSPDEASAPVVIDGSLSASFAAPVAAPDGTLEALGTADVLVDGVQLSMASGVLLDAIGDDIAYAVLFNPEAPGTWVVVAAHEDDLVTGATLALDGLSAAAIVLDELTGEARVGAGGTLSIASADLAVGGSVVGTVEADLATVDLASWPHDLFPLAGDAPGDQPGTATASASGDFSVPFVGPDEEPTTLGVVSVSAEADGFAPMALTSGYAYEQSDGYLGVALVDDSGARMLALVVPPEALVSGGSVALDGGSSAAWWIEADGSAWFFTEGTLTVGEAAPYAGGLVAGSLSLSGEVVYGGNLYDEPADPYPTDATCDELSSTFTPAWGAVLGAAELGGELPPGYDRLLYLEDAGRTAVLQALVATDADLAVGVELGEASVDGGGWPEAMLASYGCESDFVAIDSGLLIVSSSEEGLVVELDFVVDGVSMSRTWEVSLL